MVNQKNAENNVRPDYQIRHPMTILLIGARGSGKTATMHYLGEKYHEEKGTKINFLCPRKIRDLNVTPDWLNLINYRYPRMDENAVTLYDDAQLRTHAREWYQKKHVNLDKLISMSRHGKKTLIMTTQQTYRVDKNIVGDIDMLIIKKPSIFQKHMERPWLRDIIEKVDDWYNEYYMEDFQQYGYVLSDFYTGFVGPQPLPSYWDDRLGDW